MPKHRQFHPHARAGGGGRAARDRRGRHRGRLARPPERHDDRGAGSTFVSPLVSTWIPAVGSQLGYELQYSAIGSSGGINAITGRTVDFGASDAPLSPDQFTCVQRLRPDPVGAGRDLGDVQPARRQEPPAHGRPDAREASSWARSRPGTTRRSRSSTRASISRARQITIAHRSDGSGTTYNFTDYLSMSAPTWKSQVGTGTSVNWPVGVGGRGSSGVSARRGTDAGAIGYADVAFALKNHFSYFAMKNSSGKFATPGARGILAAAPSDVSAGRDERALDRQPAEEVPARLSDLDLHVRDRPDPDEQGARPEEVPLLGRHEGSNRHLHRCSASYRSRSRCSSSPRRRSRRSTADALVSAADLSQDATRRPFSGRRVALGDLVLQVVAGAAAAGATALVGLITWKVVDGCTPGDRSRVRNPLRRSHRLEPRRRQRGLRGRQLPLRHGDHVVLRARARRAPRARRRALSHRARAACRCARR